MYWWSVSQLAADFQEGRVEEKERFKYYLATSIVTTLGFQPFLYYGETFKVMHLISAAVWLTVTIAGTILCYRANRNGDNTDFIGRMVCLSWPIGIRVLMLFLGIGLALMVFIFVATAASGREIVGDAGTDILGELFALAGEICIFWLLYKYISRIAHAKMTSSAD